MKFKRAYLVHLPSLTRRSWRNPLLLVLSRQVVVVGAIRRSFRAGEWWWWAWMPFRLVVSSGVTNAVCRSFRAGDWCWKIYVPSVSCFEQGRDMCVGSVAGGRIDVWCDKEGFTPPLATSKMAYDVMRRGETLLVTSLCLQRFRISQYNKRIYLKKTCQLLGMGMTAHPPSFCCRVVVGVVVVFATSYRIVVVGSGGVEVSGRVGCCVWWQVMWWQWCDVMGTHTHTRINPDPWERVWVPCGLGPGGRKITQGLPVTCTSGHSLAPPPPHHPRKQAEYACFWGWSLLGTTTTTSILKNEHKQLVFKGGW